MNKNSNDIINICQDGVFKAVFTKDTPESGKALASLLSAFIGKELTVLSITTNEVPIDDTRQRKIRYDISVKFNDGELANIEITVNPQPAENIRMEYYAARLYVSQDIRGKKRSFKDLKPTYHLSIIENRAVFNDKAWHHKFVYYDPEQNITLGGRTAIITVELTKLKKIVEKTPAEMSRQEKWAVYFGYYTDTERQGLLREIEALEEGIKMAETVMNGFTQTELENLRQLSLDMQELDRQEELYWAEERATEKGIAKGITIGKEKGKLEGKVEGKEEAKLEVAKKLLNKGLPVEDIAEVTGLGLGAIMELASDR
jgi:predicted transposase/invertase (TIGR01784 family)